MEEEIIIRLYDSAFLLDAEMTAICVALETPVKQDYYTHRLFDSCINILNIKKLDLNTITRNISDAVSRLTQMPTKFNTGYPPILEYRVTRMQTRLKTEAYNLIEYTIQLMQAISEYKQC